MAGVLRIDNLNYRATLGDIRRVFKESGVIPPADIHLGAHSNGKANGAAFVVFTNRKDAEDGLCADGFICRDNRINVRNSNPKEFDKMFPGKPMLSNNQKNTFNRGGEDRMTNVVKVERINYNASPSDIRRFFKDHDARPEDIHLILQPNSTKHNGCAFLIFSIPSEAMNALKLDGVIFFEKRLIVKASNPKEFDRFFPRVPMITKGNARGRGRGRATGVGMNNNMNNNNNNNGNVSRSSIGSSDGRTNDRFNNGSSRGRGRGGAVRGGRGGGGVGRSSGGGSGRYGEDQFFSGNREDGASNPRGRSRSPVNRNRRDSALSRSFGGSSLDRRQSESTRDNSRYDMVPSINERKFLHIYGLPYDASQIDIQNFFRPILTRDIYMMRNSGGKYAGKFNGNAIAEFFSEGDSRQAIKMDGRKFGSHVMSVIRPGKDEIVRTIEENKISNEANNLSSNVPDFSALNAVAQSNPQVQHLLNLLTATVNTIAGAAAAATQSKPDKREYRDSRGDRGQREQRMDRSRDDPVINRVASSAKIDVSDIKLGRVVGMRNLPYTVTPNEILQFFRNYKVLADSVRIHYLEDGRCSGDAIICFRGNRDARNAVNDLNKGTIGRRKVELFFL